MDVLRITVSAQIDGNHVPPERPKPLGDLPEAFRRVHPTVNDDDRRELVTQANFLLGGPRKDVVAQSRDAERLVLFRHEVDSYVARSYNPARSRSSE